MFRLNNLASPPVPLNFSTPPRTQSLFPTTPDSPATNTPSNVAKTLTFGASPHHKFHLAALQPNQQMKPNTTPNKSWNPNEPILSATPLRSSTLGTPESISTPEIRGSAEKSAQDSGKRGRPRADVITHLILEGSSSPSGIKCRMCNRVFPREKSLQAHIRTHTGEKPYSCDYPGCSKSFRQSGQLKTHQRLHAGEKPFVCAAPGCNNRYTHANRTCPAHPYHKPQRTTDLVLQPSLSSDENSNQEIVRWLENYKRERQEKTPGKEQPTGELLPHVENSDRFPSNVTPLKRTRSKRGLNDELEQQENSPVKTKKENVILGHQIPRLLYPPQMSFPTLSMAPKSPIRNLPLALLSNNRSILEERLKIPANTSPPRRSLSDITAPTNGQSSSPENREGHGLINEAARNALNVLLAAAASRNNPVSPKKDGKEESVKWENNKKKLVFSTPPQSPIKNPKKRWLKNVFQEEEKKFATSRAIRKIPSDDSLEVDDVNNVSVNDVSINDTSVNRSSSPINDEENLAMPIRWSESDEHPINLFSGVAANPDRRSPLSMAIASTLVAMSSDKKREADGDAPLNLSKK